MVSDKMNHFHIIFGVPNFWDTPGMCMCCLHCSDELVMILVCQLSTGYQFGAIFPSSGNWGSIILSHTQVLSIEPAAKLSWGFPLLYIAMSVDWGWTNINRCRSVASKPLNPQWWCDHNIGLYWFVIRTPLKVDFIFDEWLPTPHLCFCLCFLNHFTSLNFDEIWIAEGRPSFWFWEKPVHSFGTWEKRHETWRWNLHWGCWNGLRHPKTLRLASCCFRAMLRCFEMALWLKFGYITFSHFDWMYATFKIDACLCSSI